MKTHLNQMQYKNNLLRVPYQLNYSVFCLGNPGAITEGGGNESVS